MIRKEFLTLPIGDIHPYKGNPRRIGRDAVDAVIASIKDCENLDPIEVDENNVILSGHTRYKALTKLKYQTVVSKGVIMPSGLIKSTGSTSSETIVKGGRNGKRK